MDLCSVLCGSLEGRGVWGKNAYVYMYGWVPSLFTWNYHSIVYWLSVQLSSSVLTVCNPMDCSIPGFPVHHQLLEPTQTHVHHIGDAIQPSHPLLFPSPLTFNLSQNWGLFQWVCSLHQVAKVLEFQLQHQPSNEHSGLISFRMAWLDLLAVQGTLKSLLPNTK